MIIVFALGAAAVLAVFGAGFVMGSLVGRAFGGVR